LGVSGGFMMPLVFQGLFDGHTGYFRLRLFADLDISGGQAAVTRVFRAA